MSTPANALTGPVWVDAEGNAFTSTDGGKTFAAVSLGANIPIATPSTAGLMSAAIAAALGAGLPVTWFETPTIDMTATLGPLVLVPGVLGKTFIPIGLSIKRIINAAGSRSTAGAFSAGSNGSNNDITAANGVASSLFTTGTGAVSVELNNYLSAAGSIPGAPGSPVLFSVGTAATGTGGFALSIVYAVAGFYA